MRRRFAARLERFAQQVRGRDKGGRGCRDRGVGQPKSVPESIPCRPNLGLWAGRVEASVEQAANLVGGGTDSGVDAMYFALVRRGAAVDAG